MENQINDIQKNILTVAQSYKVQGEVEKYATLEDVLLNKTFRCLNYVLFDDESFDWNTFK